MMITYYFWDLNYFLFFFFKKKKNKNKKIKITNYKIKFY